MSWRERCIRVFVSHASEDHRTAQNIAHGLEANGIDCYILPGAGPPLQEWVPRLEEALDTCDALLALLTDKFHRSVWTNQEIGFARGQKKLIVPLCLGDVPEGLIYPIQGLEALDQNISDICRCVFRSLAQDPLTRGRVADVLADRLCNANSLLQINRTLPLMRDVDEWPDHVVLRVRRSVQENPVFRRVAGVENTIEAIFGY